MNGRSAFHAFRALVTLMSGLTMVFAPHLIAPVFMPKLETLVSPDAASEAIFPFMRIIGELSERPTGRLTARTVFVHRLPRKRVGDAVEWAARWIGSSHSVAVLGE